VPDEFSAMAQVVVHRKPGIVIAITAGKDNNAKFHELRVTGRLRTSLAEAGVAPHAPQRVNKTGDFTPAKPTFIL
jgi:hypothetical protein